MKRSAYILSLCMVYSFAHGQTNGPVNNLGNEDVTIIKPYQPVLNDAFKINVLPEGDTSSGTPPVLKYDVETKQLNTPFNITPIKPVKIKDDVIKKLYRGFAKVGYGNYNTPLVELKYNSIRSKEFAGGVYARHLSSSGNIDGYGQPDYSENGIGVNGTRYLDGNKVTGELNFNRDVFHFYGYKSPPEMFSKSETKHLMNMFDGKFGFASTHTNKDRLSYNSSIGFNKFSDNLNSDESLIAIQADGGKRYKDSYISAAIELDAMHIDQPLQDDKRTVFKIDPRYAFKKDKFFITAGANLAYENGDYRDSKLHFYPHARLQFQLLSDQVTLYSQFTGSLKTNTLVDFTKENKFLDDFTYLLNTSEKVNFSGGINAKLSRELMVIAGASVSRLIDQPFYINLPENNEPVKYSIIYDDAGMVNLHGEIDYTQAEKTGFGIRFDYYSWSTDSLEHPLFLPSFRIGVHGKYAIGEKIYLKSELYFNDGTYAIDWESATSQYIKMKSYVDINLGVDYRYSKILSAFVQLNNLGMQKYFRYYNYPSYRLNAMAGITYTFW